MLQSHNQVQSWLIVTYLDVYSGNISWGGLYTKIHYIYHQGLCCIHFFSGLKARRSIYFLIQQSFVDGVRLAIRIHWESLFKNYRGSLQHHLVQVVLLGILYNNCRNTLYTLQLIFCRNSCALPLSYNYSVFRSRGSTIHTAREKGITQVSKSFC